MKRVPNLLLPAIFLLLSVHTISAQNGQLNGKPIAELFTDFHININDTASHTGFGINRAYIGYQFLPEGHLSAKFILNVGSPDDLPAGNTHHRYAYFREASLAWSGEKLTVTMGLTSTKLFEFQQAFWGKRYIANTYQSMNGFGFVADLGIATEYRINDKVKAELIIMNGEGYNELQVDDKLRTSVALTLTPTDNISIRMLGDIQRVNGLWQPLGLLFAGFKNDHVTIGGEITYKSNIDLVKGHHAWGVSATGALNVARNTEVFARFDYSTSVIMPGDILPWNFEKNGNFIVAGFQQTLSPNVKVAIDYQGMMPYSVDAAPSDLIYFNALFKF